MRCKSCNPFHEGENARFRGQLFNMSNTHIVNTHLNVYAPHSQNGVPLKAMYSRNALVCHLAAHDLITFSGVQDTRSDEHLICGVDPTVLYWWWGWGVGEGD